MQIIYQAKAPGDAALDGLALFFAEDKVAAPAGAPAGVREAVAHAAKVKEFTGKSGQVQTLFPQNGKVTRLVLVGLGAAKEVTREKLRRAAGTAGMTLAGINGTAAGVWLPKVPAGVAKDDVAVAMAEGLRLGAYKFTPYKNNGKPKDGRKEVKKITVFDPDKVGAKGSIAAGQARADAMCLARDLGNQPANAMTPTELARQATAVARRHKLKIQVMDRKRLEQLGMGMFMGVAKGSRQPPKFILMEYRPAGAKKTLAFVGKGITFDSGGISIKPGANMDEMKFDMCGAAAVVGAMDAIGTLKPKVNVIGVVPACENLPDGEALKPGDILKSYSGKHVEILNTDAEGRLILGDALAYTAKTFKPDGIVDLATLTGACVVALGHYATGAVSNNDAFLEQIVGAGKSSGDTVWPLPNFPEYEEELKGKYADLQNVGSRYGGAITAGLFLKQFVGDVPWVHLDIAGTAWGVTNVGHIPDVGATGVGVALLTDLAMQTANGK